MNQSSTGTQSQQNSVATTTASQPSSRSGGIPPNPPTGTAGTGSHTPHQPVEFNHAISYVNKIKVGGWVRGGGGGTRRVGEGGGGLFPLPKFCQRPVCFAYNFTHLFA